MRICGGIGAKIKQLDKLRRKKFDALEFLLGLAQYETSPKTTVIILRHFPS
jgi:hypothetical protein